MRLTNSHQLEVILLGPVDQPGGKRVDSAGVGLVHERDVAVAAGAGLLERLLALLGGLVVPVARVDVVGDDLVVHRLHGRQEGAARLEVRRAHVERLLANQVDEGVLNLGHLAADLRLAHAAHVAMGPRVRGDLVARRVRLLDRGSLVVDTAVERAGPEEGGLGARLVEDVDQLRRVLVRSIVVGKSEHPGAAALLDHHAGVCRPLDEGERVRSRRGDGAGGQEQTGNDSFGEHLVGGLFKSRWRLSTTSHKSHRAAVPSRYISLHIPAFQLSCPWLPGARNSPVFIYSSASCGEVQHDSGAKGRKPD